MVERSLDKGRVVGSSPTKPTSMEKPLDYGDFVYPVVGQQRLYCVLKRYDENGVYHLVNGDEEIAEIKDTVDIMDRTGFTWRNVRIDHLKRALKCV
jgi:hypothetical protein